MPRRPDPEPLETDDVRLVAVGTGLWAVALVVLGIAKRPAPACTAGGCGCA
ncbi:MAG: hypothetical protein ABIO67_12595 [Mycobacteriales bacterium]